MKKIIILGAGVYQAPAIEVAKDLGLKTIVVSKNIRKYPGNLIADISENIDTTDIKQIYKIAKKYQIDGIFTTGTDVALKALGYINSKMNLCGPNYKACLLSTNKIMMKKAFVANKVPTAKYFEAQNPFQALKYAKILGFPVMVKAINSSGSRGISRANNKIQFKSSWKYAKKYSKKNDAIIIEEYLRGNEFGAQAFVYKGKIKLICLHNDTVTPAPFSTPFGHSYPYRDMKVKSDIKKIIEKSINALGINNSAVNIDLIQTPKGVKILEIGARMGATCLPQLTEIYTGVQVTRECIKMAIGLKPDFKQKNIQPTAGSLIGADKTGILKNIIVPDSVFKNNSLIKLSFDVKVGVRVNKFKIGPDRIGEIVVIGKNLIDVEKKLTKLQNKIKFEIV